MMKIRKTIRGAGFFCFIIATIDFGFLLIVVALDANYLYLKHFLSMAW